MTLDDFPLLICDLDGTLLGPDSDVSSRTASAIAGLHSAGVRTAVATGRIPQAISPLARYLGLEGPQITMHGGLVTDLVSDETVLSSVLGPSDVDAILSVADEIGDPVLLCYPDGFKTTELGKEIINLFVPFNEPIPEVVPDLTALRGSRPHKIAISTGADGYERALALATRRLGERYTITSGDNRSIEFLPAGVDKGTSAGELARWYGWTLDQVAAAGDGTNDIPMLSAVGRSVAMRHARPEVRAAADMVIPDDQPDDLAAAIGLLYPWLPATKTDAGAVAEGRAGG
jgi:Cof subfamily protein (haloacid dehalogenase superfamily)